LIHPFVPLPLRASPFLASP